MSLNKVQQFEKPTDGLVTIQIGNFLRFLSMLYLYARNGFI